MNYLKKSLIGLALAAGLAFGVSSNTEAQCPKWRSIRAQAEFEEASTNNVPSLESQLTQMNSYLESNAPNWVKQELFPFLSIPSIMYELSEDGSTKGMSESQVSEINASRKSGVDAANYLKSALDKRGFKTQLLDNPFGNPVVYGSLPSSNSKAPTIMIYGHYDVQPVKDKVLDFNPTITDVTLAEPGKTSLDQRINARGASDDKGQIYTHLFAIDTYRHFFGEMPFNFKFFIEGGEEAGSPGMEEIVKKYSSLLQADLIIATDSKNEEVGVPSLDTSLRGLLTAKIFLKIAEQKLHSGLYGGPATSCFFEMAQLVSRLKDPLTGKVNIKGFYDSVQVLTDAEKKELLVHNPRFESELTLFKIVKNFGEASYSPIEQILTRPTLEVTNISEGIEANLLVGACDAYVTIRLVADQDPHQILSLLQNRVYEIATEIGLPSGAIQKVEFLNHAHPVRVNRQGPLYKAAEEGLKAAYHTDRINFKGSGGSEAIITYFNLYLGSPTLMHGYGSPEDNAHADNEGLLLKRGLIKGIEANVRMYLNFGKK